uniref:Uncharacterized protein n=1 Tax=viral metagenome TaxID=1070528 RepID=A0A6M3IEE9_9ZZZZ
MRATRNLLETCQGYLKEVGSFYLERLPEKADMFILVSKAIEEIKEAVNRLIEEI